MFNKFNNFNKINIIYNEILYSKGENILILNNYDNNNFIDYIIICTANSKEHVKYIKYNIIKKLNIKKNKKYIINEDPLYEWIVIDLINIIIHIMQKYIRNFYLIDYFNK